MHSVNAEESFRSEDRDVSLFSRVDKKVCYL